MKTKKMKQLTLNKTTITKLDAKQMQNLHGGEDVPSNGLPCTEELTICNIYKCLRPAHTALGLDCQSYIDYPGEYTVGSSL